MGKQRSIRGEIVDFDLMKVKSRIESGSKPNDVEMREKYIDIRRRRNPRRNVSDLVREQQKNANDAREKIRISKENALKAKEAAKAEEDEVTVSDVVEVQPTVEETVEATPTETTRKIAKRTSTKKED